MNPMDLAWDSLKKNWYQALARYRRGGQTPSARPQLRGRSVPTMAHDMSAPYATPATQDVVGGASANYQAFGQHLQDAGMGNVSQGGTMNFPAPAHTSVGQDPRVSFQPPITPQVTSVTAPGGPGLPHSIVQGH